MLLSGCNTMWGPWPIQSSKSSIGKTYDQLVEAKRLDKQITAWPMGLPEPLPYNCYSCDGSPTRTYTNPAGNTVAAYFYTRAISGYNSDDDYYIFCDLLEERYELRDSIVVDEWYVTGWGKVFWDDVPQNGVCAGYSYINAADPPPGKPHAPSDSLGRW